MISGTSEDFMLFQQGDQKAFKLIYDDLAKTLLAFSWRITRSTIDSEDIVAMSFVKLYTKRDTFDGFDNVRRWIFIVVKNGSVDFLREQQKKHKEITPLTDNESDTIEDDADMEMLKYGLLQALMPNIEKLPKQRKKVIVMTYFQQKDTNEIARVLHLDPQTVLNHKTRGLAALKKLIPYNEYTIY